LIEDNVARQRSASVYSFEEIVADQSILGYSPLEALVEGGDFVDPLADIDAFAEEILIDVRNGAAVDVDCRISGVKPREERAVSAFWRDLDPRLDDRVAGAEATSHLVDAGTVKGMCERAHEAAHGSWRERRVRVGRNDEPDAARSEER